MRSGGHVICYVYIFDFVFWTRPVNVSHLTYLFVLRCLLPKP
jgi:hypothetical protein